MITFRYTAIFLLHLLYSFREISSATAIKPTKIPSLVSFGLSNKTNKIVGGRRCSIKQHPYIVSMQSYEFRAVHFCAGSLISKIWVLTARHCLSSRCYTTPQIMVLAGSEVTDNADLIAEEQDKLGIQKSLVQHCYLHPGADYTHDIALAKLKVPILETANVGYIKLPFGLRNSHKSLTEICSNSTVLGWGAQYAKDSSHYPLYPDQLSYDPYLQCVQLPVISQQECQSRTDENILPSFFCAYKENKDACQGDSGGPLVCNGYLYGLVSNGNGCAFSHFPETTNKGLRQMKFV